MMQLMNCQLDSRRVVSSCVVLLLACVWGQWSPKKWGHAEILLSPALELIVPFR